MCPPSLTTLAVSAFTGLGALEGHDSGSPGTKAVASDLCARLSPERITFELESPSERQRVYLITLPEDRLVDREVIYAERQLLSRLDVDIFYTPRPPT